MLTTVVTVAGNLGLLATACGGLAALVALLHLLEQRTGRFVAQRLGWRAVLVTGWLGVPLHELSHLLAARLFAHRIIAWELFDPDPVTGTLGYVRHAYSERKAWQLAGNFFIGIAPLLAGAAALSMILRWSLPASHFERLLATTAEVGGSPLGAVTVLPTMAGLILDGVWSGRSFWLPLQLYLGVCVASHTAPSLSDLKGSLSGLWILLAAAITTTVVLAKLDISMAGLVAALAPLGALVLVCATLQALWVMMVAFATRKPRRSAMVTAQ